MQLKSTQIVVTLNLDSFRRVGLYSDCVHIVWTAFLTLTDNPTLLPPSLYKPFGEAYAAFSSKLHADYLDWRV